MGPRTRSTARIKASIESSLQINSSPAPLHNNKENSESLMEENSEDESDFLGFETESSSRSSSPTLFYLNEKIIEIKCELDKYDKWCKDSLSHHVSPESNESMPTGDLFSIKRHDAPESSQNRTSRYQTTIASTSELPSDVISPSNKSDKHSVEPLCAIQNTQGNFLNFFSQTEPEVIVLEDDDEAETILAAATKPVLPPSRNKDTEHASSEQQTSSSQCMSEIYYSPSESVATDSSQICIYAMDIPIHESTPEVITLDTPEDEILNEPVVIGKRVRAESTTSVQPPTKKMAVRTISDLDDSFCEFGDDMKYIPLSSVHSFTGREDELQQLSSTMKKTESSHQINVVLTGPPGIGKTELVLKYLEHNTDKFDYIFWFDSNTNVKLQNDIQEVAKKLKLSKILEYKPINYSLLMNKIYSICNSTDKRVLIIFDEVDKPSSISKLLPSGGLKSKNMQIIVTSQYTEWLCDLLLPIKCFSLEDSHKFLTQYLPPDQDVMPLLEILGNIPFALQAAISYINYKQKILKFKNKIYTVQQFINDLNQNPDLFFDFKIKNSQVGLHWYKCLKRLSGDPVLERAFLILKLISFLEITKIPVDTLNVFGSEEKYLEALLSLNEHSLIYHEQEFITLNPLFKIYIKTNCDNPDQVLNILLNMSVKSIEASEDKFTIAQAMQIWALASQYDNLVENFSILATRLVTSKVITNEKKLMFTETYIDSLEKALGWENQHFLQIQTERAFMFYNTKQFEKCSSVCSNILKLKISDFKANFYYYIISLKAKSLEALNQFEDLFQFHKHHYEQIIAMSGAGDNKAQELLRSLCVVAFKLYEQERSETWTSILFTLVQNRARDKASNFDHTLEITNDIAESLIESNNGEKALLFYDRLYEACVKKFNSDHNLSLKSLYSKAVCLYDLDKIKDSWDLLLIIYTKQDATNQNCCETLMKMCEVACKLDKIGNSEVFNMWLNKVKLKMKEKTDTFKSHLEFMEEVSDILEEANKRSEALLLFDLLHESIVSQLGETSLQSVESLVIKAQFLCDVKNFNEAWEVIVLVKLLQCNQVEGKPSTKAAILNILQQIKSEVRCKENVPCLI